MALLLVRDDKVVNILPEAPPEGWSLPDHTVIDAEAQIGWIWNGSAWVDPTPPINLSAIAAEARYLAETSGIALNGATILTDRESQALINGAVSLCQINPAATVKFKTVSGAFVTLDATQVIGIGVAVGTHVQACFAREADVASEIAAGTLTTEAAVRARFNDLVMP